MDVLWGAGWAVAVAVVAAAWAAVRSERRRVDALRSESDAASKRAVRAETEAAAVRAQLDEAHAAARRTEEEQRRSEERMGQLVEAHFRTLATEILEEKSRQFGTASRTSLEGLLGPLGIKLDEFRTRVEHIHAAQTEQGGMLRGELRTLMELNRRITQQTEQLTVALRGDSKVQGDWGEAMLESILTAANLVSGVHYRVQESRRDAEGNLLRPDVVLQLPEKHCVVIDSKVSLRDYVAWVAARSEPERTRCMAQHVAAIRAHVLELSRREYQKLYDSPDFVVLFVANEPAFLAAMQAEPELWSEAYRHKVVISSPTNLFALLKLVDELWRRAQQESRTADIVRLATRLYEQMVAFTGALEGIGTSLDDARRRYDDAYKRLCTGNDNVVRLGERLRQAGRIATKKRPSLRMLDDAAVPGDDFSAETLPTEPPSAETLPTEPPSAETLAAFPSPADPFAATPPSTETLSTETLSTDRPSAAAPAGVE